jgi:hypothetical protein
MPRKSVPALKADMALPSSPDNGLLYAVELRTAERALHYLLARIWMWLDKERSQPRTFRYRFDEPNVTLRVDFPGRNEAEAFAQAFGGKILA